MAPQRSEEANKILRKVWENPRRYKIEQFLKMFPEKSPRSISTTLQRLVNSGQLILGPGETYEPGKDFDKSVLEEAPEPESPKTAPKTKSESGGFIVPSHVIKAEIPRVTQQMTPITVSFQIIQDLEYVVRIGTSDYPVLDNRVNYHAVAPGMTFEVKLGGRTKPGDVLVQDKYLILFVKVNGHSEARFYQNPGEERFVIAWANR